MEFHDVLELSFLYYKNSTKCLQSYKRGKYICDPSGDFKRGEGGLKKFKIITKKKFSFWLTYQYIS